MARALASITTTASTTSRTRASRAQRFEDIAPLRAQLPRYWWNEVSRVRALIDADVETGGMAAEHFEYVAEALAGEGDETLARSHAAALWTASRRLSAIAQEQQRARA